MIGQGCGKKIWCFLISLLLRVCFDAAGAGLSWGETLHGPDSRPDKVGKVCAFIIVEENGGSGQKTLWECCIVDEPICQNIGTVTIRKNPSRPDSRIMDMADSEVKNIHDEFQETKKLAINKYLEDKTNKDIGHAIVLKLPGKTFGHRYKHLSNVSRAVVVPSRKLQDHIEKREEIADIIFIDEGQLSNVEASVSPRTDSFRHYLWTYPLGCVTLPPLSRQRSDGDQNLPGRALENIVNDIAQFMSSGADCKIYLAGYADTKEADGNQADKSGEQNINLVVACARVREWKKLLEAELSEKIKSDTIKMIWFGDAFSSRALDKVSVDGANPYLDRLKKGADPALSYNRRVEIIIATTGRPPIVSGWPAAWALDKKPWKVDEGFWTKHSQPFQKFQNLGDDNYYNNILAELRKFPGLKH